MEGVLKIKSTVRPPFPLEQVKDHVLVIGASNRLHALLNSLNESTGISSITVLQHGKEHEDKRTERSYPSVRFVKKRFSVSDLDQIDYVVIVRDGFQAALAVNGDKPSVALKVRHLLNAEPFGNRYDEKKWKKLATMLIIAFALMVLGHIIISFLPLPSYTTLAEALKPYFTWYFLLFVLTGFLAQMVDGVLSMGYGVTSATCLMSFGINPVSVSAAIHTSEVFTSGISGYSHYKFGNVNMKLFRHLVIPGMVGAVIGAVVLVFLGERAGSWLLPVVALYAMFLGIKILVKAFSVPAKNKKVKRVGWLAGIGGFFDSFGGGGWGPIVTSTLISKGRNPRYTIGSVSLTEFFITMASAATFFITAGTGHWNVVLGLLIGGAIAAPLAAKLSGKLPRRTMMIFVGIMVIIWCIRLFMRSVGL